MGKKIMILIIFCIGISFTLIKSLMAFKNATQFYVGKKTFSVSNITSKKDNEIKKRYAVYQNGILIKYFDSFDEAKDYALGWEYMSIKDNENNEWLWDNNPNYSVYTNSNEKFIEYNSIVDAFKYARVHEKAFIYHTKTNALVWTNLEPLNNSHIIKDVPLILQKPELPRGCEVTSLAMLLQYAGVNVDKMELAENIKKDETPMEYKNGQIYFGNPNNGFVGDMYNTKNAGLGVYHKPIYELAEKYLPNKVIDLTGLEFNDLLYFINQSKPIWIIINSSYQPLPLDNFETWITPTGVIKITYKEHSVVITGYDNEYIYFNDPLYKDANRKALKSNFIKAWEQMGRQAVTYL